MQKSYGKKAENKRSIRKPYKSMESLDNKAIFLYGKFRHIQEAVGYCKLHRCYLDKKDIFEKRCIKKNCREYERR